MKEELVSFECIQAWYKQESISMLTTKQNKWYSKKSKESFDILDLPRYIVGEIGRHARLKICFLQSQFN